MASSAVEWVEGAQLDKVVAQSPRLIVDFWAEWCAPCKRIEPVLDAVAGAYQGRVRVVKVDADKSPDTMQKHGVMGLPTILFIDNGRIVDRVTGFVPEPKMRERIDQAFRL